MKRIVVTFGLISGAISSLIMAGNLLSSLCFTSMGEVIGYSAIVLSFLLVFFGIRSYRDSVGGGSITFARAFSVGLLITLVSSICYVVTWEILYFNFMPDFGDKFLAYYAARVTASGTPPASVQAELQQMTKFLELYRQPLYNVAFTILEPLPIGIVMTLISAAILRKRNPTQMAQAVQV